MLTALVLSKAPLDQIPKTTENLPDRGDLRNVIRQALADAPAAGRGYLTQTEEAVRAVRQVRPDMTASAALLAVEVVQKTERRKGEAAH